MTANVQLSSYVSTVVRLHTLEICAHIQQSFVILIHRAGSCMQSCDSADPQPHAACVCLDDVWKVHHRSGCRVCERLPWLGSVQLILTWQGRYHDQEGGSPRARLNHCTPVVLTSANSPNVGISIA